MILRQCDPPIHYQSLTHHVPRIFQDILADLCGGETLTGLRWSAAPLKSRLRDANEAGSSCNNHSRH